MRALEHAGFILSGNSEIRLTLLQVTNNTRNYCEIDLEKRPNPVMEGIVARTDKACIDQFYAHR